MIDVGKASYKIAWMCALLGVPRSSFYAWRNKAETATAARRRELASDGTLALLLVAAYVLSRGWRAWSTLRVIDRLGGQIDANRADPGGTT